MTQAQIEKLIQIAIEQLSFSYAPYSHFHVGAALLTEDGQIFTGCNIENSSYSATICAERTAIFKAISEGVKKFRAICIVGGKDGNLTSFTPPCGVCRQVMTEFCDGENFEVILAKDVENYKIIKLNDLMPMGFGAELLD